MITKELFESWSALKNRVSALTDENRRAQLEEPLGADKFLFRGESDATWELKPTLHRDSDNIKTLEEYYEVIQKIKPELESFNNINSPEIEEDIEIEKYLKYCRNSEIRLTPPPYYEFLVYLRHHGCPSPLLDWTRSLYIAAYFACDGVKDKKSDDLIAIYMYQECSRGSKGTFSTEPRIETFGPTIKTHNRHHSQQAEYTMALHYRPNLGGTPTWHLADYALVTQQTHNPDQDKLWKLMMPASGAKEALKQLEQDNIRISTLFGTENKSSPADKLVKNLSKKYFC